VHHRAGIHAIATIDGVLYGWCMASDAQTGRKPASGIGAVLRAPFSAWSWRTTCHVVSGAPVGLVTFAVVAVLMLLTVGLAATVVLGAVTFLGLVSSVAMLTSWQRSRFAAFLGVVISPMPRRPGGSLSRRLRAEASAGRTWRQFAYHLLAGVLGPAGALAVVAVWAGGIALSCAPLLAGSWSRLSVDTWRGAIGRTALTALGLLLVLAAPWLARLVAAVDTAAARALLGPSRGEELARRVESLAVSRSEVVDAADAARRRIERDLHDGTQQRLTSLAMNLGIALATMPNLAPPARDAIAQAHDEAKQTLAELREFVRGMHPAVLDDLGLDAALSGIVARSPVPVRLAVTVPERAAPAIEAIAYFLVSEALTNAVKHANAHRVYVTVARVGDLLHVTIVDDGRGGADPAGGSGLRGLAQRVGSVDGTLRVDSPVGGPTVISAELPCES
jgi:signal transduction histidine kinase